MPTVYHYKADTGEYLHIVTDADEDPMEPGRYLVPANSTTKIPPFSSDTQWTVFRDGDWVVEPKPKPDALQTNVKLAPQLGLFHNVSIMRALKGGVM